MAGLDEQDYFTPRATVPRPYMYNWVDAATGCVAEVTKQWVSRARAIAWGRLQAAKLQTAVELTWLHGPPVLDSAKAYSRRARCGRGGCIRLEASVPAASGNMKNPIEGRN